MILGLVDIIFLLFHVHAEWSLSLKIKLYDNLVRKKDLEKLSPHQDKQPVLLLFPSKYHTTAQHNPK